MHTKGKVHNHSLIIHLQQNDGDKENEHTCIAKMNEVSTAYSSVLAEQEARAEHFVHCWNAFEEGGLIDKLLGACEAAFKQEEDRAGDMAYKAGLGVGEWEAFLSSLGIQLQAAIAEAKNDKERGSNETNKI